MPLAGNEHLPEKFHRKWADIERMEARLREVESDLTLTLAREVEMQARLDERVAAGDLSVGERKALRGELADFREAKEDFKAERERLPRRIDQARRQWRAELDAEAGPTFERLAAEMDRIVDALWAKPLDDWHGSETLNAARIICALALRWCNTLGDPHPCRPTRRIGGISLFYRIPLWDKPSGATSNDLIRWVLTASARGQARLAEKETR
jgi:hypothetical protein